MSIKQLIKSTLTFLHLDITKNMKYDRLTTVIMKKNLKKDSNCIDIGCHKGEILDLILEFAPEGNHFAFEPIPYLFDNLKLKFNDKVSLYSCALSDKNGESTFNLVKNAPAYSGIKKRKYDIANPEIEEIKIEVKTLDNTIPNGQKIDFIKIDVEGGEFDVFKGGKNLLKNNSPIILFEFGKGASDYYGTKPADIFNLLTNEINLQIFTLKSFIKKGKNIGLSEFENYYNSNSEYYFVATPK